MNNFGQKPQTIPLEKAQFFDFFNFLFFQPRKAFFCSRILLNTFSSFRISNKKIYGGKMANFGQKPWSNPFGKISVFSTFLSFCFCSEGKRFFTLEYHKLFFRPILLNKKLMLKSPILDKKPWTNPFGKISIFRLF